MKIPKLLFVVLLFSSCHAGRTIIYNFGDYDDYKKFAQAPIAKGEQATDFPQASEFILNSSGEKVQAFLGGQSLDDFFTDTKSTAFLVLRNDSLIFERYYNKHKQSDLHCVNSVSKSFISLLFGIALQEGKIKSVEQPVTDYIKELRGTEYDKMTIEDLLYMRSGVDFSEAYYNPFGDLAKFYYGNDLRKHLRKLKITEEPGTRFEYVSSNTDMLGWILEEAIGGSVPEYLSEKVWQPLEMQYEASWSLDSKKNNVPKYSYGLNTRSIDLLKLGQLYLHQGKYKNKEIINSAWVSKSTTPDAEKRPLTYQNHWWYQVEYSEETPEVFPETYDSYTYTNADGQEQTTYTLPTGNYYAAGFLGQFIYVFPEKNIVIVRTGKRQGKVDWLGFFKAVAEEN